VPDATVAKMSTLHMYAYQKGLKTGMYYLRTKTKAQQIHINTDTTQEEPVEQEEQGVCYINNPECSACSG
jgi:ribonucleotide reductase alpha subunit